jgi:hypothetical protein
MKLRIATLCLSMLFPLSAMAFGGEKLIPPEKFNAMPDVSDYSSQDEIAASVKSRQGVKIYFKGYPPKDDLPIIMFIPGGDWNHEGLFPATTTTLKNMGLGGVLITSPSGFRKVPTWFRETKKHNQDIDAVIRFLRKKYPNNQIWMSGSSKGSVSAGNVATRSAEGVDGVIFFSSISHEIRGNGQLGPVTQFPLSKLKIPVLAVHHKRDACPGTKPPIADEIVRLARNAPVKKAIYVEGGEAYGKDPCENGHYHGYAGIQEEVWTEVGKWVIANYKR